MDKKQQKKVKNLNKEYNYIFSGIDLNLELRFIIKDLYNTFSKQYHNFKKNKHEQKSLNILIIRLVFCLYADAVGLFKYKNQFHKFLTKIPAKNIHKELIKLFKIMNQKEEDRNSNIKKEYLDFPYVDGGLFSDKDLIIPKITDDIKQLLLSKTIIEYDWEKLSPTFLG